MFEPVHGSAPDIAGQGKAHLIAMIWSAAQMLEHLGETAAAASMLRAVETVTASGQVRTPDMGGSASTMAIALAIAGEI